MISQIFQNQEGRFVEVSDQSGEPFSIPIVARGIATADIDQDGDLDVLFTINDGPPRLLRNDSDLSDANWIDLRFSGATPNLHAVGAQVTVWADGLPQKRMVRTGSSYLTQSDHTQLLVGLGASSKADSVTVSWPTGGVSRLVDLDAGMQHEIIEGSSL